MKKITVKLTAIVLSAFIFLGGVGGSYIEGYCAGSGTRFLDVVWNYDDSIAGNLLQYVGLYFAWVGAAAEPTLLGEATVGAFATAEFLNYMNSDKGIELTEEEIPQYFEDNVSTVHQSADGSIHGGGGMVLPDDLVDALHHTAQAILDEQSGYWLIPTLSVNDPFFVSKCSDLDCYNYFKENVENNGKQYVYGFSNPVQAVMLTSDLYPINPSTFISDYKNGNICSLGFYKSDWSVVGGGYSFYVGGKYINMFSYNSTLSIPKDLSSDLRDVFLGEGYPLFSFDGHPVRVWKSVDAYKLFSVGKQPYYCTNEWVNYDYSQDNSMTLTNTYLGNVVNGGVVNNYYNVVQDAIDENNTDGALTEDQIRDIVTDTINQLHTDNNTDQSGGSGDSGNSGNDDSSGGGIGAVIDGIGKFFDTLLTLVGKIIGMLSDFVNSVLSMFESFTVFTDGFSGFLTGAFGFIPQEAINVIVTGITLLVILAIIKFLK